MTKIKNNMYSVGLIDFDTTYTRKYWVPNYDLCIIYSYFKDRKDMSIRLVSSFSKKNLEQYDKIYVFKRSNMTPHPSSVIEDYYKLPIEEYGSGFIQKPIRPFLLETRDLLPDCSCYNNILLFSMEHPKNKIAWRVDKGMNGKKYKLIKLYEEYDGEELKKDYPTSKYNMIYERPAEYLNNKDKWNYINELMDKGFRFKFAQSLDISAVKDTNILEQVFQKTKYHCFREYLIMTDIDKNSDWLIGYALNPSNKKVFRISIRISNNNTPERCIYTMLLINFYIHKSNFKLFINPYLDREHLKKEKLALLLFDYLKKRTFVYMSFYEYVANIGFCELGIPQEMIITGEERYTYLLNKYGTPYLLIRLEDFIRRNPNLEESIFIGGESNYVKQRRECYDSRGSKYAFTTSANNIR